MYEERVEERRRDRVEPGDFHLMFNSFLDKMSQCMDKMSTAAPSGRAEVVSSDVSRQIEKLAAYTSGTDIATYIKKLEDDLCELGVSESRYKSILARRLQSGRALSVLSSINRAECSYEELKKKLIDGLGSNLTSLGIKLISDFQYTTRSMTSRDAYIHLKGLVDSVGLLTNTKEDVLLFMATAIYRASRPLHQRGVMDSRSIDLLMI